MIWTGRQPPEAMPGLLDAMDVAVAPHAQQEGAFYFCPLKILEYAASGCATVASRQGDIPLLLGHGEGGEIVADDHVDSWTSALRLLIYDDYLRTRQGRQARAHVHRQFTWQQAALRIEDTLFRALGAPSQRASSQKSTQHRPAPPREEVAHS